MIGLSYAAFTVDKSPHGLISINYIPGMDALNQKRVGDDLFIGDEYVLSGAMSGYQSADVLAVNEKTDILMNWKV